MKNVYFKPLELNNLSAIATCFNVRSIVFYKFHITTSLYFLSYFSLHFIHPCMHLTSFKMIFFLNYLSNLRSTHTFVFVVTESLSYDYILMKKHMFHSVNTCFLYVVVTFQCVYFLCFTKFLNVLVAEFFLLYIT